MTKEEFILKAKSIHGDKYDYSKVEYVNGQTKVCIICPKHGEFWQRPYGHLSGKGCKLCGREQNAFVRRFTLDKFLQRAQDVHGDKYDYSNVKYIGITSKIQIRCPKHGDFWQTPQTHLSGSGCPKCGHESNIAHHQISFATFVEKANAAHSHFYSYDESRFNGLNYLTRIICPNHGEFWQKADSHMRGCGCPECAKIKMGDAKRKNFAYFLQRARNVHENKYQYMEDTYKSISQKITIICPKHGVFNQMAIIHINGSGCPKCAIENSRNYSKEECLNAALLCYSRQEFYKKHPDIVRTAKKAGWYQECCAHMERKGNKQRLIYAYEFPEYNSVYVGLTFKMSIRDKRHHKEGTVFEFAKNNKCEIPIPKELTDLMDPELASIQEGVWEQKYKEEGWHTLNKIKTGNLGGQEKLDYSLDKIENSMEGYNSLQKWTRDYGQYREYIRANNLEFLLDKYFPNRIRRKYTNYEECKHAYSECNSLTEVKKKYPGAVDSARKHGWHKELSQITITNSIQCERERFIAIIATYKKLKDFRKGNPKEYQLIKKRKWYNLLNPLEREVHTHYHFTTDEIKEICSPYHSIAELKAEHKEIIGYCFQKGIDLYVLNGWRNMNNHPIKLIKDGKIVGTFDSIRKACDFVGCSEKKIKKYMDAKTEYYGYYWESCI